MTKTMDKRPKTQESVLRMTLYKGHTLVPAGDGKWLVYSAAGALLGFCGRTEFTLRHAKILVRLALALRAR